MYSKFDDKLSVLFEIVLVAPGAGDLVVVYHSRCIIISKSGVCSIESLVVSCFSADVVTFWMILCISPDQCYCTSFWRECEVKYSWAKGLGFLYYALR